MGAGDGVGGADGDTLPDAGDGVGGADGDTLPDAGDGADGATLPPPGSAGAPHRRPKKVSGRKRGVCPKLAVQRTSKYDSLVWRDGGSLEALEILNERFGAANKALRDIQSRRSEPDTRSLTYKQIQDVLGKLSGNNYNCVFQKLEKSNYRHYGITLHGSGQTGTAVKDLNGREGHVSRFFVDEGDGYNAFEIRWSDSKRTVYTTRDVLEAAERCDSSQGVTSVEEADRQVKLYLQAVLSMVLVLVKRYLCGDDNKQTGVHYPDDLAAEILEKTKEVRAAAWQGTMGGKVTDMMTDYEKDNLKKAGKKLFEDADAVGSLLSATGLEPNKDSGATGFVYNNYTFHQRHERFVNHFVRGAQVRLRMKHR